MAVIASGPYWMTAQDSGTSGPVFWWAADPALTPDATQTLPNFTGVLSSQAIEIPAIILYSPVAGASVNQKRFQEALGASVGSFNNLTLGNDGTVFHITGSTSINSIRSLDWQAGAVVKLLLDSALTITHNTGGLPAGFKPILLSTAANWAAPAGSTISLAYDGTSWYELGRMSTAGGGTTPDPLQLTGLGLGIAPDIAVSRLKIKGLGTSSATYGIYETDSSNNPIFFVRDDGRVGIGTSAPGTNLDLAGASGFISMLVRDTGSGSQMYVVGGTAPFVQWLKDATGTKSAYFGMASGGSPPVAIDDVALSTLNATVWTERLRVMNATGRVGIGTAAPLGMLDVAGAPGGFVSIIARDTSTGSQTYVVGGTAPFIQFAKDSTATKSAYFGMASSGSPPVVTDDVALSTLNATVWTERLRVMNATGRVGIGTAAPLGMLDIAGAPGGFTSLTVRDTSSGARTFLAAGTSPFIQWAKSDSPTAKTAYLGMASGSAASLIDDVTLTIYDGSTWTERLRITNADGYLGVGNNGPKARVDIIGKGNTNSTTSLWASNSDLTPVLKCDDDGIVSHQQHAGATAWESLGTGKGSTTDATQTTIWSFTLPDARVFGFEVDVVARETAGADRMFASFSALVYREGGGATIQGTVVNLFTAIASAGAALWAATLTVNGNAVRVSVTGAAATTIRWACRVHWQGVADNS